MRILSRDVRYDLSCACSCGAGDPRRRGLDHRWLYPVTLADGGRSLLFKTLASNYCANDCRYCPLRSDQDQIRRCTLAPEEIVRVFMPYWRARQVVGIFLSSGVSGTPDAAMERLLATAEILRRRENYRGILHLKILPGASEAAMDRALQLASGVSLNVETAGAGHFAVLSARKNYHHSIVGPLRYLLRKTAPGTPHERVKVGTQFVVGAADETDREVVAMTARLYREGLHRALYSAYQRGLGDPTLPGERRAIPNADLLRREHRLYQTDYLLRKYEFPPEEIPFDDTGNLSLETDPKELWARRHPERFPVNLGSASRFELLRVPGLGPISVDRILAARRRGVQIRRLEDIGLRGARARKAAPWLAF